MGIKGHVRFSDIPTERETAENKLSQPADVATLESLLQSSIGKHEVVIFSKTYCPHCRKTKNLFRFAMPKVEVKIFELDTMADGDKIQAALFEMTGQRTVPNVFVKGEHLGGNDDTQAAYRMGKLATMLGTDESHKMEDFVKNEITKNNVVIFTKSYCPYCRGTKELFRTTMPDINPRVVELDSRDDGDAIQTALFNLTRQRTVPSVFVNGKHLGGDDDTKAAYRSGKLQELLQSGRATSTRELVKNEIKQNDVVIFTKSYCPHCRATLELFRRQLPDVHPKVIELDTRDDGDDIQTALHDITKQRTVPNVFVKGRHLGGNDDTQAAYMSGTLQGILDGISKY